MSNEEPPKPIRPINFAHYISMLRQFKDDFKSVVYDYEKVNK